MLCCCVDNYNIPFSGLYYFNLSRIPIPVLVLLRGMSHVTATLCENLQRETFFLTRLSDSLFFLSPYKTTTLRLFFPFFSLQK